MDCSKRAGGITAVFLAMVLALTGCQSGGSTPVGGDYRDSFTDEEKKSGKASFELMENVAVDADITPAAKYSGGLRRYYMENYYETKGKKGRDGFVKNPSLYGRKLPEMLKMVANEMETELTGGAEWGEDGIVLLQRMKKGDGSEFCLTSVWDEGGSWPDDGGRIGCPYMYVAPHGISDDELIQEAYSVANYNKNYEKAEAPFVEDKEAAGGELKAFMQELLGRTLCDKWDFIPVTEETVSAVNQALETIPGSKWYHEPPETGYGVYLFYADVDGLPYVDAGLGYHMKEGETASEMSRISALSATSGDLVGLGQHAQIIVVSEQGIIAMQAVNTRMQGGIYRDREKVLPPDDILGNVREYYERLLLTSKVTVTGINLVYTGYFTDGSEGEIRPTVAPFWKVDAEDGTKSGNLQFYYDAFTGEQVYAGGWG